MSTGGALVVGLSATGKTDIFASILGMAEFRHPIFGRLADFPYIKIGTL